MRARWQRGWALAAAVALTAGGVVGCGDDDAPASTGTTAPAAETTAPAETTTTVARAELADPEVTRGADGSLTIAWKATGELGAVEVSWGVSPDAATTTLTTAEAGATSVTVADPKPGSRVFFRLTAGDAERTVAERRVVLEGVPNFRDLGGYETEDGRHVKWGQLYRSGALGDLKPEDMAIVDQLGIKLVCDLRSDSEVEAKPDPAVSAEALRLAVNDESVNVQAITDAILAGDLDRLSPTLLLEGMPKIAIEHDDGWRTLLQRVADPANRPTNVHCTAGKDRAGWASALILRTLGVPEETVMQDYLRSNDYLKASNDKTIAQVRGIVAAVKKVPEDQVDMTNLIALLDVRAEYLQAAFDAVDAKYGSFEAYVTDGLGFTQAEIDAFRDSMLE